MGWLNINGNWIGRHSSSGGWGSYWRKQSEFFLDGTIITVGSDKYFKDKSVNGRNFLITGYDFASDWTTGFPYKSAATISAPAGDAALMAADINNFLYDAGGTPNQIPVVSLFQDIDYEHKIFCKHAAQVVDGNGVETYEPRVTHIFMAQSVLSGADLTKAYVDFEVPAEDTTAKWVAATGNDTTGDGTKTKPYLTVDKAVLTFNAWENIYVKTNLTPFGALNDLRNNKFFGIGNVVFEPVDTTSAFGLYIWCSRIYLKATGVYTNIFASQRTNAEFDCIRIDITDNITPVKHYFKTFRNSIFAGTGKNDSSGIDLINQSGERNIIGCLFSLSITGISYAIKASDGADSVNILRNKFLTTVSTIIGQLAANLPLNIIGNEFIPSSGNYYYSVGNRGQLVMSRNIFKSHASTPLLRVINEKVRIPEISYNEFDNSDGISKIYFRNSNANIHDNIFKIHEAEVAGTIVECRVSEAGALSSIKINNNKILISTISGAQIIAGLDVTSAGDAQCSEIEVQKNYIRGTINPASTCHSILCGYQLNPVLRYNYIDKGKYGFVIEGSADTWTTNGCNYNIIRDVPLDIVMAGISGAVVSNNTIISSYAISEGIGLEDGGGACDNCVVKNNIIISLATGNNYFIGVTTGTTNLIDYNIYYCPNGTMLFNAGAGVITFAEWQALGYDEHSIVLTEEQFNGLFTDFAGGDYSLKAGSVAIGAGEDLGEDYDDGLDASTDWGDDDTCPVVVTKQQGVAWDCGAYVS